MLMLLIHRHKSNKIKIGMNEMRVNLLHAICPYTFVVHTSRDSNISGLAVAIFDFRHAVSATSPKFRLYKTHMSFLIVQLSISQVTMILQNMLMGPIDQYGRPMHF